MDIARTKSIFDCLCAYISFDKRANVVFTNNNVVIGPFPVKHNFLPHICQWSEQRNICWLWVVFANKTYRKISTFCAKFV